MTAPTLPTTLARLAELLPERVRRIPSTDWGAPCETWQVGSEGTWFDLVQAGYEDWLGARGLLRLEYVLREECEARGWDWAVYRCGPTVRAVIYEVPGHDSSNVIDLDGEAATPARALALALVEALAALEGGGA